MPKYRFQCKNCQENLDKNLSISEFLSFKNNNFCPLCEGGKLEQVIVKIRSSVEKDQDQILMDIQSEVQDALKKIESGDKRTIEDIYGDTPNPHKKNGVF